MTGPSHYREAEARLAQAHGADPDFAVYLVAKAQVHATLALAAATIDAANGETEATPWLEAVR